MRRSPMLAAVLAAGLLVATAGCGDDDDGPIPQTGEVTSENTTTTAGDTSTTTAGGQATSNQPTVSEGDGENGEGTTTTLGDGGGDTTTLGDGGGDTTLGGG